MESFVSLAILGLICWAAYQRGKQLGSRKGYSVAAPQALKAHDTSTANPWFLAIVQAGPLRIGAALGRFFSYWRWWQIGFCHLFVALRVGGSNPFSHPLFFGVEFRLAASYQTGVESVLSTLSLYPPSWPRFTPILSISKSLCFGTNSGHL